MPVVSALLQDEVFSAFEKLPNFVTIGEVAEMVFQQRLERNIPPHLHEEAKKLREHHSLWPCGLAVKDALISLGYELVAPVGGR